MGKKGLARERLLLITCECGAQIPIVYDIYEMSSLIELHIKTHKMKDACAELSEAEYARLEDLLISKIFEVLGK
jgi:hypothetical protein